MIQILGLRPYFDRVENKVKMADTFFKMNWRAQSVIDLFTHPNAYLSLIPEDERWNIFYTLAQCTENKREFDHQEVMAFDIDKIDLAKIDETVTTVNEVLGVTSNIVSSGNGLHFIINLTPEYHIKDASYFDKNRRHYNAICARINESLKMRGLPGKADPSIFEPRRLMRLPGTVNRKESGITQAKLIYINPFPTAWSLTKMSGLPEVEPDAQISLVQLKHYPRPDTQGVLEGCLFLKHCKDDPNAISEPEWYAALSVVGRLENGRKLAHEISWMHAHYSMAETDKKLDQALESSGPRTCKDIQSRWGGCTKCPHYEKITSPILIRSAEFIATESTGFHALVTDSKGNPKPGKPSYADLRKAFERDHQYISLSGSGITYVYDGKYYKELEDVYLEAYAQDRFKPYADSNMTREFKNLIHRTNLQTPDWFNSTTHGKINFLNGVLDLKTMDLAPHSPYLGFRYILNFEYDPQATCPAWDSFLNTVMSHDEGLKELVLQYGGYALSNDTPWTHKALVLEGEGSNGKSTLIKVLKALAGDGNYSSVLMSDMHKDHYRQMLDGKLFNITTETPSRSMSETAIFKMLADGEEIQVKQLYKKPYLMRSNAKLIFACNELPRTTDTSYGFFRRFIIVPFVQEFTDEKGNKDPHIEKKLLQELPGIFNQMIAAHKRLQEGAKFHDSSTAKEALRVYQLELDSVAQWVEDNLVVEPILDPKSTVTVGELYQAYRHSCEIDLTLPVTAIAFGKRLRRLIPEYEERFKIQRVNGVVKRTLACVRNGSPTEF